MCAYILQQQAKTATTTITSKITSHTQSNLKDEDG